MLAGTAAVAASLLLLSACSGGRSTSSSPRMHEESEAQENPGVVIQTVQDADLSVRLLPEHPVRGTRLILYASGFLPEDGTIEWTVDGGQAPVEGKTFFRTDDLKKGSSVQAKVTIGGRVLVTNVVTMVNSPPEIRSVRLISEAVRPGDAIGVEALASDPDGDEVRFEYSWKLNDVPAGTSDRLQGTLKRNDRFSVTVTPFDGTARGRSATLEREVVNYPPSIDGIADARLARDLYTCRVVARDGDGDPLTYALKESPPGMSIDAGTGAIRWKVPPDFQGKAPVTVSVSDGKGGESKYAAFITIGEETTK